MNTEDRQSFGSEKDENYGCGRSGQPSVALGSVPAPLPVPWHAIAGLSHVLGGRALHSGVRHVKWAHDDLARPWWRNWEQAAAVAHTLMVSSKPDDKMTKSEGTSTRSRVPGVDNFEDWSSCSRDVTEVGILSDGEPPTVLV